MKISLKPLQKLLRKSGIEVSRHRPTPRMEYPAVARLLYFQRMLLMAGKGTLVECGVGKGYTFLILAMLARTEGGNRQVWGFDSFVGYPKTSPEDAAGKRKPKEGEWAYATIPDILALLADAGLDRQYIQAQTTIIGGYFQDSLSKYRGGPIALLHLDVNLHDSYKTCLEQLYPMIVPGGVIMFDEYLSTSDHIMLPAAHKAIDDFLKRHRATIHRDEGTGKYYAVKEA